LAIKRSTSLRAARSNPGRRLNNPEGFLKRPNCYYFNMTVLLEKAIESVRALPAETQDSLARMLLQFAVIDLLLQYPESGRPSSMPE
jgi:hypothetical protein